MTDTLRAVALLLSLLMWSPAGAGLLRGEVSLEKALLTYAGAAALALAGCALLASLVRAYAPAVDAHEPGDAEPGMPLRRAEDAAA